MDKDGDGTITFKEMLEVTFPFSSRKEIKRMLEWVNTIKEQGKLVILSARGIYIYFS